MRACGVARGEFRQVSCFSCHPAPLSLVRLRVKWVRSFGRLCWMNFAADSGGLRSMIAWSIPSSMSNSRAALGKWVQESINHPVQLTSRVRSRKAARPLSSQRHSPLINIKENWTSWRGTGQWLGPRRIGSKMQVLAEMRGRIQPEVDVCGLSTNANIPEDEKDQ